MFQLFPHTTHRDVREPSGWWRSRCGVAADVASFQLGPSHAGPDPLESGCAPIGDGPDNVWPSRIEAHLRELRSDRLDLLRI